MKKSLLALGLFMALAAGTAHADSASSRMDDLFRFDMTCNFGSVGCSAQARVFLNVSGGARVEDAKPTWFGNLLAVSCRGQLISASDATLFRQNMEDGVHWELYNADQTVEIDLKDHPFNPNGANNVPATLEIDHSSSSGTCDVKATDVHNR